MRLAILVMGVAIAALTAMNVMARKTTRNLHLSNQVLTETLHNEEVQAQRSRIAMLKGDQLLMAISGGTKLPDDVILSDERGEKTLLKTVTSGGRKFIFRYSQLNCNVCVDAVVPMVRDLANEIGGENVIFLATYMNGRDLMVFRRVNQLRAKIYNVESLPTAVDGANVPYCFVLEPDNTISHLFIPRKEMLEHAEDYFAEIVELWLHGEGLVLSQNS